jgi:NAD(P)-dependent dehydrogenase (short-subunit alcohol dehydrogenase family)
MDNLEATRRVALEKAPAGTRVTSHACDVSDENQMLAFRDAVMREHDTRSIDLLFNNAGIGGGGSFLTEPREAWDKTFAVCWNGVYFGSRAFLPLLVESAEGYIVNTSSVNGFWASLGANTPHTAYSAAKFAVKGFTEALITDLRINAPHVKAAVVMPGHVGTSIVHNSARILGRPAPDQMGPADVEDARKRFAQLGIPTEGCSDEEIKQMVAFQQEAFEKNAPLSAEGAAKIILDGVRAGKWRILVGEDAQWLDEQVRDAPEDVYDPSFANEFMGMLLNRASGRS